MANLQTLTTLYIRHSALLHKHVVKALVRSENLLALALTAQKEIFERRSRSRSIFRKSCALAQYGMSAAQFCAHF